jgi:hypothetical protein
MFSGLVEGGGIYFFKSFHVFGFGHEIEAASMAIDKGPLLVLFVFQYNILHETIPKKRKKELGARRMIGENVVCVILDGVHCSRCHSLF